MPDDRRPRHLRPVPSATGDHPWDIAPGQEQPIPVIIDDEPAITRAPAVDLCDEARAAATAFVAHVAQMPPKLAAAYVAAVRAPFEAGVDVQIRVRLDHAGVGRLLELVAPLAPTGR